MRHSGFTLAELLIALAILGIIATFTIPKILSSQQNGQFNSAAKEAIAAVSEAYYNYKLNASVDASTAMPDLTPFLNYTAVVTTSSLSFDNRPLTGSTDCGDNNYVCLKLHNGGILAYQSTKNLGGTDTTNAFWFVFDPEGGYSGSTTGAGKGIQAFIYFNGRIRTKGSIENNTVTGNDASSPRAPDPTHDPEWFSWN